MRSRGSAVALHEHCLRAATTAERMMCFHDVHKHTATATFNSVVIILSISPAIFAYLAGFTVLFMFLIVCGGFARLRQTRRLIHSVFWNS